jgi:hypothetical protein
MPLPSRRTSLARLFFGTDPLLFKVARLSAFLLFVQVLITALVVRGVHAQLQDLVQTTGAQVAQLGAQLESGGPPRTLRLNGAQVRLQAQRVDGTLAQVLDQFQQRCRGNNGRFYEQLQAAPQTQGWSEQQLGMLDGVMRVETPEAGSVACLDTGSQQGTPETVLARAEKFVATGDLAAFGGLRLLRAEKRSKGVFVVMFWTDGALNVRRMFPAHGDAPGIDFTDLPRPPGSRRILSAWEEGEAPAINIYESRTLTPAQLDHFYRVELARRGWEALLPPARGDDLPAHPLMVMRDGVTVTLSQTQLPGQALSTTTIMPADTRGALDAVPP